MRRRSLRLQLIVSAILLIGLALLLAGIGLVWILDHLIEKRLTVDMDRYVKQLAAHVQPTGQGSFVLQQQPTDPRFDSAYGGLYWQITGPDGQTLRSRSLWDVSLALETAGSEAARFVPRVPGPADQTLLAVVRRVELPSADRVLTLQIMAAIDRANLLSTHDEFLDLLVPSLIALGLVLTVAMIIFLQRALAPFRALSTALRDIHMGRRRLLEGDFPDELEPVIADLNRLILLQEQVVEQARTQAADLAHGLKTPLAVLNALARKISVLPPSTIQEEIETQTEMMSRQAERSLARARIQPSAGLRRQSCQVVPVIEKLVAIMKRLPQDRLVEWKIESDAGLRCACNDVDLTEMLGNLLDNARKWTKSLVLVQARSTEAGTSISVEDDGPGIDLERMTGIERGRRWDESRPGSGFGLAITRDLAQALKGDLDLARSPHGGLRAVLHLPR